MCDFCTKGFTQIGEVKAHQKRIHNGYEVTMVTKLNLKTPNEDLSYGCNFCNMRFKNISDAKKHNLSTHSIPRPFSCKHCYKKFTQSGMKSDSEG